MRVRHGCLLAVCLLLCGCGATTLFSARRGPTARPVETALSLARFLENQVQTEGITGQTECYPSGGTAPVIWRCLVNGVLGDGALDLDIAYRRRRFVELGRSAQAPEVPLVSVPGRAVLGAKAAAVRNRFDVQRVTCAETSQAAWCDQTIRFFHVSLPAPGTIRRLSLSLSSADRALLQLMLSDRDCGEPPYCAPPSSAFK